MLKRIALIVTPFLAGAILFVAASPTFAAIPKQNVQGVITIVKDTTMVVRFSYYDDQGQQQADQDLEVAIPATPNGQANPFTIGSNVYFVYDNGQASNISETPYNTNFGVNSQLFGVSCASTVAVSCWVQKVWEWSSGAILIFSVGAVILAGIFWMTSTGDPKRIAFAKKLLLGAVSAILVIVLGKMFLTNFIGVPWL